jgi:hypothetical protein
LPSGDLNIVFPNIGNFPTANLGFCGTIEKAASGVLTILPCSRTDSMHRASNGLRPCWTNFFDHSFKLMLFVLS